MKFRTLVCLAISVGMAGCSLFDHGPPVQEATGWSSVGLGYDLNNNWPDEGRNIAGLRLGLLGARHHDVYGLDLPGFLGQREGDGGGLAVALLANDTKGSFYGVQVAGLCNSGPYGAKPDEDLGRAWGVQIAPANFGDATGVQLGLLNGLVFSHDVPHNDLVGGQVGLWNGGGDVYGVQVGAIGCVAKDLYGVQCGAVTFASRARGVQLGLWNTVTVRGGLQIGLLNYNAASIVPWFPLVNFSW
jgi:hypothetical protein